MDIALFKKMCRLIDFQRRLSLIRVCQDGEKRGFPPHFTHKQLNYLMLIRMALPCNLNRVMDLTGLSSSAASLFIEKMCIWGLLNRQLDLNDRRNVTISPTEKMLQLCGSVDKEFDCFIDTHIQDCTPEEIASMERCGAIVCRKISELNKEKSLK